MKKWISFVAIVLSSVAATSCGDEPIPEQGFVNYATHVQPILTARCVRCHGGGGTLNADPDSYAASGPLKAFNGKPPINGFFDCGPADRGTCPGGADCKRGFLYYAKDQPGAASARAWLGVMPPPPSPPLTERESQILARWLAQPDSSSTCP